MLTCNHSILFLSRWHQEAYSVARQFNLIPPVCEQAEYHYFQRDKVEVQLPELYHKIGQTFTVPQLYSLNCVSQRVDFVSPTLISLSQVWEQ